MCELGFVRSSGRYFSHPDTDILVEFPPGPLAIGGSPVTKVASLEIEKQNLELLTPTQCVMDRLAAYYHWDDRESLEQALLVAGLHDVDLSEIKSWSDIEGMGKKFSSFMNRLDQRGY